MAERQWLYDHSIKDAVDYVLGKRDSLPPKAVVISDDDGWESVYTYFYPIIKKYQVPVTLFIYPGTISEGKHAMTWAQLTELQASGLFDIEGHTLSHPNFKQAKRHQSAATYEAFVKNELVKSKQILEEKLNKKITLLAWPFGIYDAYLEDQAKKADYVMAFSIDARPANRNNRPMAVPRFMIVDGLSTKTFMSIANSAMKPTKPHLDTK